jgi:hypothetical protein
VATSRKKKIARIRIGEVIGCEGCVQAIQWLKFPVLAPPLYLISIALQHDHRNHEARWPHATTARYTHRARSDDERRTGGLLRFVAAIIKLAVDLFQTTF